MVLEQKCWRLCRKNRVDGKVRKPKTRLPLSHVRSVSIQMAAISVWDYLAQCPVYCRYPLSYRNLEEMMALARQRRCANTARVRVSTFRNRCLIESNSDRSCVLMKFLRHNPLICYAYFPPCKSDVSPRTLKLPSYPLVCFCCLLQASTGA